MNEADKRDFEARLRTLNWSNLKDGSGCHATTLPDNLMEFAEIGEFNREQSEFFYTYLTHQQTRGTATVAAIPFLAELLDCLPNARAFLIDYLVGIALGCAEWYCPKGYRPEDAGGSYMTPELKQEIYQSVERLCFPIFLALAQDYDPQQLTLPDFPRLERDEPTQILALWALSWFPARADEARPTLEKSARPIARFALEMLANAQLPAELVTHETDDAEYLEALQKIYFSSE